jgi:GNAT superfamily N-acetyltransferase
MNRLIIRRAVKTDRKHILSLIKALAKYEKLKVPSQGAQNRLIRDAFGKRKRFDAYLAFVDNRAVGYAIIFETYSSFLALPTLYLEDIFVLSKFRKLGVGMRLFLRCFSEARRRGCGRMEWVVLDWNKNAIQFYEKLGAKHLKEWLTYRLERKQFYSLIKKFGD